MAATKYVVFVTVLASFLQGVVSQDLPVTQVCLGCICEAISRCNTSSVCSGDVCGPFRITWGYWADSGKPVLKGKSPDDPDAYSSCAGDTYCAALSVQGYMRKFQQDCNNNKTKCRPGTKKAKSKNIFLYILRNLYIFRVLVDDFNIVIIV